MDAPLGDGSAREALAAARARLEEADAAAESLQDQVRQRLSSSTQDATVLDILMKKAERAPLRRAKRVRLQQGVRIHNASHAMTKFRQTVRGLHRFLPHLGTPPLSYKSRLGCTLRWRPPSLALAAFMHIGKAGGTAFRRALLGRLPAEPGECRLVASRGTPEIGSHRSEFNIGRLSWSYTKGHKHEYGDGSAWEHHIPELLASRARSAAKGAGPRLGQSEAGPAACRHEPLPCLCTAHFDFSLLQPLYRALPDGTVAGLALMRDPVDRFLSHFYHARKLEWTAGLRIREVSPLEFLQEPDALLDALMVWQDGVAGVSWWAGDTVHFGMGATGDLADGLRLRASIQNRTETLRRAVRNYHRFIFVGLLEEMEASLALLQYVLGWRSPPHVEHLNVATPPRPAHGTPAERRRLRAALRVLAPMDMWFYEYVKADFNERIAAMQSSSARDECAGQGASGA